MTSSADLYNRQLHPQEKTKAQQIASAAKDQGLTNPDGSPITAAQIENAMRGASNSQYGEIAATGVVVPLNANTPASGVYDTTGMKLVTEQHRELFGARPVDAGDAVQRRFRFDYTKHGRCRLSVQLGNVHRSSGGAEN